MRLHDSFGFSQPPLSHVRKGQKLIAYQPDEMLGAHGGHEHADTRFERLFRLVKLSDVAQQAAQDELLPGLEETRQIARGVAYGVEVGGVLISQLAIQAGSKLLHAHRRINTGHFPFFALFTVRATPSFQPLK